MSQKYGVSVVADLDKNPEGEEESIGGGSSDRELLHGLLRDVAFMAMAVLLYHLQGILLLLGFVVCCCKLQLPPVPVCLYDQVRLPENCTDLKYNASLDMKIDDTGSQKIESILGVKLEHNYIKMLDRNFGTGPEMRCGEKQFSELEKSQ